MKSENGCCFAFFSQKGTKDTPQFWCPALAWPKNRKIQVGGGPSPPCRRRRGVRHPLSGGWPHLTTQPGWRWVPEQTAQAPPTPGSVASQPNGPDRPGPPWSSSLDPSSPLMPLESAGPCAAFGRHMRAVPPRTQAVPAHFTWFFTSWLCLCWY